MSKNQTKETLSKLEELKPCNFSINCTLKDKSVTKDIKNAIVFFESILYVNSVSLNTSEDIIKLNIYLKNVQEKQYLETKKLIALCKYIDPKSII